LFGLAREFAETATDTRSQRPERAILVSRSLVPLFPKELRNKKQVFPASIPRLSFLVPPFPKVRQPARIRRKRPSPPRRARTGEIARRVLTEVTDRPEIAVRLSERLALSVGEAAAAMGVSERLMRTVLPDIPHCHVGNRVVIPVSLLEEWLREQAGKRESVVGKAVNEILGEIQSS
jgi:hypothetical protein